MTNINGYQLSRQWFDFAFANPELISPNHAAIYFFAMEHYNRLGQKEKFGFPTQMAMEAIGIKKHQTYIRYFDDLVEWGFFTLVQKSQNQYSANIISLKSAVPKNGKAMDKAIITHAAKQTETNGQSIGQSNSPIDKQLTINHKTNNDEKKNSKSSSKNEIYGSTVLFELEELKTRLEGDQYWIEISAKNLGAEISQIEKAIPEFIIHLGAIEEIQKSIKDAKRHFNSWYPKRKNNQNLKNDNGHTNSEKVGKLSTQQLADFTKRRPYTQHPED